MTREGTLYCMHIIEANRGGSAGLSAALSECGAAPERKPRAAGESRAAVVALRCDIVLPLRSHNSQQSAERERTAREVGL